MAVFMADRDGVGQAPHPASPPDRRAGRGVSGSCEPARSAAVDPGLGGGLAVTELLARVGGSSVSLNCPCADQGGRHVDMVVVLIIVVVLVLVFGVMRRRGR